MGRTWMSKQEVLDLLAKLEDDWPGKDYDLLRNNCCHFSSELCRRLGVDRVPRWVTNLAATGEWARREQVRLERSLHTAAATAGEAAVSAATKAATKAEELDEEYKIRENVTAGVGHVALKAGEMDEEYRIRETVADGAHLLVDKVDKARKGMAELDQHYQVTETAGSVVSVVADAAAPHARAAGNLVTSSTSTVVEQVKQASPHAAMVIEEAEKATSWTVELAQDTMDHLVETGKQARGADPSEEYQFGDMTRGLVQRVSMWGADWVGGEEAAEEEVEDMPPASAQPVAGQAPEGSSAQPVASPTADPRRKIRVNACVPRAGHPRIRSHPQKEEVDDEPAESW